MKIIYCSFPVNNKVIDPDYQNEYDFALKNGFEVELINFEELLDKNVNKALKSINECSEVESAIFRGWMLKPEIYELLYEGLKNKKIQLINNSQEYLNCHYFPYSYEIIKDKTPESIWLEINGEINYESLMKKLKVFKGKSIIVKDYVKSQKHKWAEACFINSSNDQDDVKKIVSRFIELQGNDFNKGLVFREYCQLEFIGNHSKSKMPLTKEYRMFFLNGELIDKYNYWDEGDYKSENPNIEEFSALAKSIKSNFFTMDIAKTIDNKWIIIELGDGQTAGLPDNAHLDNFYSRIKELVK